MILKGSRKWDSFLRSINRYVSGESKDTPNIQPIGNAQIAYLGGGYWRAILLQNPITHLLEDEPLSDLYGIYLVNPDRSQAEIQAIERGVAILAGFEYVDPKDAGVLGYEEPR